MKNSEGVKLIFPRLSYKIVGLLFEVYNGMGSSHRESFYQKAISNLLSQKNINFKEQLATPILFKNKIVGRYYLDFLIEDKIILEIKTGERFLKRNIDQVYSYLTSKKLHLGIIANFTRSGVKFKRILNIK